MATKAQALGSQTVVRANIDLNSEFDVAYVTMNALGTVVACYGLLENSPAVVIGAMIITMLLGPIAGVSLGLSTETTGSSGRRLRRWREASQWSTRRRSYWV